MNKKLLTGQDHERLILGAIFINPTCLNKARRALEPESFDSEKNRIVYEGLLSIADKGQPIEVTFLADLLSKNGGLKKIGGKQYLFELAEVAGTSADIDFHIEAVKEDVTIRNLRLQFLQGIDQLNQGVPFTEVIAEVEEGIGKLKQAAKDKSPGGDIICIEAQEILNTKFEKADEIIGRGILPNGGGLMIAGESGVGKSILRLEIAIHIAMGWDLYDLTVECPRKCLIVQFENPPRTETYRLRQMLRGFRIQSLSDNLKVLNPTYRFDFKLKGDRSKALHLVESSEAEVIIWDPLSSIHSMNENDNSQMRQVMDSITEINRKAGTSAIVIHHFGKPQEGLKRVDYRIRGATSIKDWADTAITITTKPHSHKQIRRLDFIKIRNGPQHKPILLERDTQYFTHAVVKEDHLVSPERIGEILADLGGQVDSQGQFAKVVAEDLGCSERQARRHIKGALNLTIREYQVGKQGRGYRLFDSAGG